MFPFLVALSLLPPLSSAVFVALHGCRRRRRPRRYAPEDDHTLRLIRPHNWIPVGGSR